MGQQAQIVQRWVSDAALVVGVVLGLSGLAWTFRLALGVPSDFVMVDYQLYVGATEALLAGANPYDVRVPSDDGAVMFGYVYPPIVAWALMPFVLLPFRVGYLAWISVCAASLVVSLVIALRAFRHSASVPTIALVVGASLTTFNVRENLYHGQIDVTLLLMMVTGLWFLARGQQIPAGVLVGMAASGKPFLGILLLLLVWRGQYRAAASMMVTGVALLAVGFGATLGSGLTALLGWVTVSRYASSPEFAAIPFNNALSALFLRLFTETQFADPWIVSRPLLLAANGLLLLVIAAAWLWAVPRGGEPLTAPDTDLRAQAGLILWVDAALLLGLLYAYGPLAETNHYFMLVPGMVATIRLATVSPNRAVRMRWRPAAVAWSLMILALASPVRAWSWGSHIEGHLSGLDILVTGRLGMLLLGIALVTAWCRWMEARVAAAAPGSSRETLPSRAA